MSFDLLTFTDGNTTSTVTGSTNIGGVATQDSEILKLRRHATAPLTHDDLDDNFANIGNRLNAIVEDHLGFFTNKIGAWGSALTLDSGGDALTSCALEFAKSDGANNAPQMYAFLGVQGSGSDNAFDLAAYKEQDIRFRVGVEAATTAMVISSDGNVGIGTPVPFAPLHVRGPGEDFDPTEYDGYNLTLGGTLSGNPIIHTLILDSETTPAAGVGPSISFRGKSGSALGSSAFATIIGAKENDESGGGTSALTTEAAKGYLGFYTSSNYNFDVAGDDADFGTVMNEAMRISSDGKVGIGTDDPDELLHLKEDAPEIWLESSHATGHIYTLHSQSTGHFVIGDETPGHTINHPIDIHPAGGVGICDVDVGHGCFRAHDARSFRMGGSLDPATGNGTAVGAYANYATHYLSKRHPHAERDLPDESHGYGSCSETLPNGDAITNREACELPEHGGTWTPTHSSDASTIRNYWMTLMVSNASGGILVGEGQTDKGYRKGTYMNHLISGGGGYGPGLQGTLEGSYGLILKTGSYQTPTGNNSNTAGAYYGAPEGTIRTHYGLHVQNYVSLDCTIGEGSTPAGEFVVGTSYKILDLGSTTQVEWEAAGLANGTTASVGLSFVATGVGAGTGRAHFNHLDHGGSAATNFCHYGFRQVVNTGGTHVGHGDKIRRVENYLTSRTGIGARPKPAKLTVNATDSERIFDSYNAEDHVDANDVIQQNDYLAIFQAQYGGLERFTVDHDGTSRFTSDSSAGTSLYLNNTASNGGDFRFVSDSDGLLKIGEETSAFQQILTLAYDGSHKVGIGTVTTPGTVGAYTYGIDTATLDLSRETGSTVSPGVRLNLISGGGGGAINFRQTNGSYATGGADIDNGWMQLNSFNGQTKFKCYDGSATADLTVDNILVMNHETGDVGIGTPAASLPYGWKLAVEGGLNLRGQGLTGFDDPLSSNFEAWFGLGLSNQNGTNSFYIRNDGGNNASLLNLGNTLYVEESTGPGHSGSIGDVGIGTSSPDAKLDVSGDAIFGSASTRLLTYSDVSYSGIHNGATLMAKEAVYFGNDRTFFVNEGAEIMRFEDGNVGIGIDSPGTSTLHPNITISGTVLDVAGATDAVIRILADKNNVTEITASAKLYLHTDGGGNGAYVESPNAIATQKMIFGISQKTAGSLNGHAWSAGDNPHMELTQLGRLGIGATQGNWQDAANGAQLVVEQKLTGVGLGAIVTSTASSSGNAGIRFATAGQDKWSIHTNGLRGTDLRVARIHPDWVAGMWPEDSYVNYDDGAGTHLTYHNASGSFISSSQTPDADSNWTALSALSTLDTLMTFKQNRDVELAGQITVTSDYRLKENIAPISGSSLDRVAGLKPSAYNLKSRPNKPTEGFIAHELAEVLPFAVRGKKDAVSKVEKVVTPAKGEAYHPAVEAVDEVTETRSVQKTEDREEEVTKTSIEEVDGKYVQKSVTTTETVTEKIYEEVPLCGEDGDQLTQCTGHKADAVYRTEEATEAEYKTRKVPAVYEEVEVEVEDVDDDGNPTSYFTTEQRLVSEATTEEILVSPATEETTVLVSPATEESHEPITHRIPVMVEETVVVTEAVEGKPEEVVASDILASDAPEGTHWRETTPAVTEEVDEIDAQSVNYSAIIPVLVGAIQELTAKVKELESA